MCALVLAYSIWFCFVTLSVWAVKLDAIAVIFDPMMQMARFPVDLYPRRWLSLLTFVVPIAFMTTYPAQALLGRGNWATMWPAPFLAAFLLWLSHRFFTFALRFYGSASS